MNFKQLHQSIDPNPLLASLVEHADLWSEDARRQDFPGSPHHDTQVIHIRRQVTETVEAVFDEIEAEDTVAAHLLIDALLPTMRQILDAIGERAAMGRVMVTRLPPGGVIDRHMDEGRYADHYDRFHLCLQADGARFECGGETIAMAPGDLWWFNHKQPHLVWNEGKVDRIHLIVDVAAPKFRELRGIYYQREVARGLWAEGQALGEMHRDEISHWKDLAVSPDTATYEAADAAGMLRCFTVRDSGRLVGYICFILRRHLHYDIKHAHQDVLFLHPDYRRNSTGRRLIRFAEERLTQELASGEELLITQHVKAAGHVGLLLERMGYPLVDHVHAKRIRR